MKSLTSVECRRITPRDYLSHCGDYSERLKQLLDRLHQPAAVSNLLRTAILWREGGVYLDTDTVTVQSLSDLREQAGFFCGLERITLPSKVVYSRSVPVKLKALIQNLVREIFVYLPDGWRWFRFLEQWLHPAANNAVMGSRPGHPLLGSMLEWMLEQSPERQTRRYSLGVHTLQDCLEAGHFHDVLVLPPEAFFPLGPRLSMHWFRRTAHPRLDEVLYPQTRVVHWYASVRTRKIVPRLQPGYIRANAGSQLFSALALPFAEPD